MALITVISIEERPVCCVIEALAMCFKMPSVIKNVTQNSVLAALAMTLQSV